MNKLAAIALASIALLTEHAVAVDTVALANAITAKVQQCREQPAGSPRATQCRSELDSMMKQTMATLSAPVAAPVVKPRVLSAGSGAPKVPGTTVDAAMKSLPSEDQKRFQASVLSISEVQPIDIRGMDLETAMKAVQANRANLLETQLKDQIAAVQAKNDQIAKLNQLLGTLNQAVTLFPSGAKADARIEQSSDFSKNNFALEREVNSAALAAGFNLGFSTNVADGGGLTKDDKVRLPGGLRGNVTKAQLDGTIQQVKSQIDSASNSQQMDMLRLQSLSNKRNEAFEVMTNFIKKMQENRAAIIGNMR